MDVSKSVRVCLLRSSDRFLIDQSRKEIIESMTRNSRASTYVKYFSAKTANIEDIIEICRTRPLIALIVLLDDVEKIRAESLKKLAEYAKRPSSHTRLIILWNEAKGNAELEDAVKSGGGLVIPLAPLKPSQLPAWIRQQVRLKGKRITPGAIEILLQFAGSDLSVLNGELEKLMLFVHGKEEITEEDVLKVSVPQVSHTLFDLIDRMGDREGAEALRILRSLMDAGESAVALVALMARHFRLLWQVKDFLAHNFDPGTIARELNLPLFVVEKLCDQSRKFSEKALRRLHGELYLVDRDIKSLGIPPTSLLEKVILEGLCDKDR